MPGVQLLLHTEHLLHIVLIDNIVNWQANMQVLIIDAVASECGLTFGSAKDLISGSGIEKCVLKLLRGFLDFRATLYNKG